MPREPRLELPDGLSRAGLEAEDLELLKDGALSVAEAARFAGLSRSTLYLLMGRGELVFAKLGRRRLIPRRGLQALLAKELRGGVRA